MGLLWTPGFWALAGAAYLFHAGYWGPHVGFYGGINYGFGYGGIGYGGGRWVNDTFQYNTAVTRVNVTNIHNTYNQTTINNVVIDDRSRTSYADGPGTRLQANSAEAAAAREAHEPPSAEQVRHETMARGNPELVATRNEGHPSIAATARAGTLNGEGVVAAKPVGPAYHPQVAPVARASQANPFVHARDVPTRQADEADRPGAGENDMWSR